MPDELVFDSLSEADTDRLGMILADGIRTGITLALNGQLGSGKTRFVRAICQGLGADESRVHSPTFVLLQLYPDGRFPVAHFDTYRLADADEFLAIGADEYLNSSEYLCLVEWAERVSEILPDDRVDIEILQTAPHSRRFHMHADGPLSEALLHHLRQHLPEQHHNH